MPSSRSAFAAVLIAAVVLSACATSTADSLPPHSEIATYVKTLAARYPASTSVVNGAARYDVVVLDPSVGYQAIYTLTEQATDVTLTVSLFEAKGRTQRLTLLVDDAADGRLDYTVTATAPSMHDALEIVRSGGGSVSRSVTTKQPVYNRLLRDLRQEAVLMSASR